MVNCTECFLCHTHLPSVWHCSHPRKEKRLGWHFNWLVYSFVFTASEIPSAEIYDCVCWAPPNAGHLKSMCGGSCLEVSVIWSSIKSREGGKMITSNFSALEVRFLWFKLNEGCDRGRGRSNCRECLKAFHVIWLETNPKILFTGTLSTNRKLELQLSLMTDMRGKKEKTSGNDWHLLFS